MNAQEILAGNNGARYFRCHTIWLGGQVPDVRLHDVIQNTALIKPPANYVGIFYAYIPWRIDFASYLSGA